MIEDPMISTTPPNPPPATFNGNLGRGENGSVSSLACPLVFRAGLRCPVVSSGVVGENPAMQSMEGIGYFSFCKLSNSQPLWPPVGGLVLTIREPFKELHIVRKLRKVAAPQQHHNNHQKQYYFRPEILSKSMRTDHFLWYVRVAYLEGTRFRVWVMQVQILPRKKRVILKMVFQSC